MFKKIISVLIILPILSGCVPAVLLAGAAAGAATGAVVYDSRTFKSMNSDHNAQTFAQRWLNHDKKLKGHVHISIVVFDGTALLVGQAQTPELRHRAYQIVKRVKGINKIYNEITIAGPISAIQRSNDAWITTKVRSALLAKPGLRSNNLKVITEDGIVFLMGSVTRHQAKLATEATRRISGVKRVVRVFNYEN